VAAFGKQYGVATQTLRDRDQASGSNLVFPDQVAQRDLLRDGRQHISIAGRTQAPGHAGANISTFGRVNATPSRAFSLWHSEIARESMATELLEPSWVTRIDRIGVIEMSAPTYSRYRQSV